MPVCARKAGINARWATVVFIHREEYIDGSFHGPDRHGRMAGKKWPLVMQEAGTLIEVRGFTDCDRRGDSTDGGACYSVFVPAIEYPLQPSSCTLIA